MPILNKMPAKPTTSSKKILKKTSLPKSKKDTAVAPDAKKSPKKTQTVQTEEPKKTNKTVSEPQQVEKKPKKVNDKPTLADNCGLNLSVARIKGLLNDVYINSEANAALKEIKDHRVMEDGKNNSDDKRQKRDFTFNLSGLSQTTLDYLERMHQLTVHSARETFAKQKIRNMSDEDRQKYNEARRAAVVEHVTELKHSHLFETHEFDAVKFNTQWDKNFYKGLKTQNWKELKDMELYKYCANSINKAKIRFNSESKIFITAFIEYVVKQLVVNGTLNCVQENKKIIKLEHALDLIHHDHKRRFTLHPILTTLPSFQEAQAKKHLHEEEPAPVNTPEDEQSPRKVNFNHYMAELCRTVKMELAREDESKDSSESVYHSTSVSKAFKMLCSDLVIDLVELLCNLLKAEIETRNLKTVNYATIQSLLKLTHAAYGLGEHFHETAQFIQEKYAQYQKHTEDRKETRASKKENE